MDTDPSTTQPAAADDDVYEAPAVADLDSTEGPAITAAGSTGIG
jgi:hypothetical protein